VVKGDVASAHVVQLFDSSESLVRAVSQFVAEGLEDRTPVVLLMTEGHWDLVSSRLAGRGIDVGRACVSGQVTVLDAAVTLRAFMWNGMPDPERFDDTIGAVVRRLAAQGGALRAYGEMVDLLAAQGEFRAAQALEGLWNGLREQTGLTLFCGYSAVNFGDPRTADALRLICRAHTHVRTGADDALGTFLVRSSGADPAVPASA
jgi:hypothetical protein